MASKKGSVKGSRTAVPRSIDEIQDIEDRLAKITDKIRTIRTGLKDGPLSSVVLKTGTFKMLLGRMEPFARKFLKDYESQQEEERDRIAAQERMKKAIAIASRESRK